MEKKTRRKTASFSFDEDTIRKFDSYCVKRRINRSRLVEDLILQYIGPHPPKETKENTDATL